MIELEKFYENLPHEDKEKIIILQMDLYEKGFAADSDFVMKECWCEIIKQIRKNPQILQNTKLETDIVKKRGRPKKNAN